MTNSKPQFVLLRALLVLLMLGPKAGAAISLEIAPSDQTVALGSQVTVDIVVSDPAGTLIGAYDFFVSYDPVVTSDPPVLALTGVNFGPSLGGPTDSFQDVVEQSGSNSVNVAELSFVSDLSALQDGTSSLLLFSLTFNTLRTGVSALGLTENILGVAGGFLGDELGQPITLDAFGTAAVTVVPIPGALWLMGSGLLGLLGFSSRRQR